MRNSFFHGNQPLEKIDEKNAGVLVAYSKLVNVEVSTRLWLRNDKILDSKTFWRSINPKTLQMPMG